MCYLAELLFQGVAEEGTGTSHLRADQEACSAGLRGWDFRIQVLVTVYVQVT